MAIRAEYIWIDGSKPVSKLRSKTKVLDGNIGAYHTIYPITHDLLPVWGFDGSSTNQAEGKSSDCILVPVRAVKDPLRPQGLLVLCEVLDSDAKVHSTNKRSKTVELHEQHKSEECWFGIEQEYTFFEGRKPLGWPEGGYPAAQGPFYCGIGADEVFGRPIVEDHLAACLSAGLKIAGINAEVMPGQWEFQIGPSDALEVSDHLWLARYLLYRISENYGVTVKLDSKPVAGNWNGAGAHTNFSTKSMRADVDCHMVSLDSTIIKAVGYNDGSLYVELHAGKIYQYPGVPKSVVNDFLHADSHGKFFNVSVKSVFKATLLDGYSKCEEAAEKIGSRFEGEGFPGVYGAGFEKRLTGEHETCSYKKFKYGVADRTASVRIPLQVKANGRGYIEDRRPCANIDPYEVTGYLIETVCG